MKLELLRAKVLAVEDEEAEDEVDVVKRVELEELKKTIIDKEEEASSVLEPDKNREEEDEEEMRILLSSRILESKVENSDVGSCLRSEADEISTNLVWYLDIVASNHMCGNENFFYKLTKVEAKFVCFENDSKVAMKGRGIIWHMQKDGRVEEIRDVYYVPELKSNILSMIQIIEKSNSVFMKDHVLYLKDKHGRLATQVKAKKNQLYELELKILQKRCLKQCMTIKNSDNSNLNLIERSKSGAE
ncbi:uncharacterized protein LOC124819579 [Vigna umbellata]|uniref:uncharacterized protein LOC124819579 n=1 Tax=Vigna umbellata TaxID=87088 RepID=UPI001F5E9BCE|nr:uncharacterized protein LOC124819579 [Vigna umbellata]